jgi:hypothetical protein
MRRDIDVYLVTGEDDYQAFFARRHDFMLTLGRNRAANRCAQLRGVSS